MTQAPASWPGRARRTLLVAVNFTADELPLAAQGTLVLSSDPDRERRAPRSGPSEALILRIT